MNLSKKQGIIVGVAAVLGLIFVVVVLVNLKRSPEDVAKVELVVWGIDDGKTFEDIIKGYTGLRPNVSVKYKEIEEDRYDSLLLNALAAGEGPDVFLVDNNALLRQLGKMKPVSPAQMNLVKLRDLFPQVVERDFVNETEVYALPLYIDTLALAYNRDLFDQGSVVFPPGTWQDFQGTVQVLRKISPTGQILKAGAAVGGSDRSIGTAQDILYLLMLQNETPMVNDSFTAANFGSQGGLGLQALNFYTQFANAASPYYTWNDSQPEFLESFAREETAMVFAYKSDLDSLKSRSPFLNFEIAFVPKPAGAEKSIAYADYYGLTASRQSRVSNWAWDFIIYATTKPEVIQTYLDKTGRPPALRSLISEKINDQEFGVYARQALTARSWPQIDEIEIARIFSRAIAGVLTGQLDTKKALSQAEGQVTGLMKNRK